MIALETIRSAQERLRPFTKRTPLERSRSLSERLGANVYLKLELFQRTGSFKSRGALNQFLELSAAARARGVVGVSGGNFAQGAAYAGGRLGVKTRMIMPQATPENYLAATRGYGAEVELAPDIASAFARLEDYAREGWTVVHPYDAESMMAGSGVVGLEIIQDLPDVTDVIVSIGGGGLIAGVTSALKAIKPELRVWGVETEGADAMARALAAGEVVTIAPTSLARTLSAPYVSARALEVVQQEVEAVLVVPDAEAYRAQRLLMERAKVVPELAAACTLSAAERLAGGPGPGFGPDSHVALLICGGNVSLEDLCAYRARFEPEAASQTSLK